MFFRIVLAVTINSKHHLGHRMGYNYCDYYNHLAGNPSGAQNGLYCDYYNHLAGKPYGAQNGIYCDYYNHLAGNPSGAQNWIYCDYYNHLAGKPSGAQNGIYCDYYNHLAGILNVTQLVGLIVHLLLYFPSLTIRSNIALYDVISVYCTKHYQSEGSIPISVSNGRVNCCLRLRLRHRDLIIKHYILPILSVRLRQLPASLPRNDVTVCVC